MKSFVKEIWGGVNAGISKILLGMSVLFLIFIAFFAAAQRTEAAPSDVQAPAPVVDAVHVSAVNLDEDPSLTDAVEEEDDKSVVYVLMDDAKQLWVSVVERYEDYRADANVKSAPPTVTNQAPGTAPSLEDIYTEAK